MKRSRAPSVLAAQKAAKRTNSTPVSKSKRGAAQKSLVSLGLGFPKKTLTTHRYASTANVTSTSSAIQTYRFSANGMFDPDITSTGHQPLYFDQLSAIYDHYVVLGSKITLKVYNDSSEESICALFKNDDTSTTNTSVMGIIEQGEASWCAIPPDSKEQVFTLTQSFSAKKTYGGSVVNNDKMTGTAIANPTEQTYFDFVVQCPKAVTSSTVRFVCVIEYFAEWTELKDIDSS